MNTKDMIFIAFAIILLWLLLFYFNCKTIDIKDDVEYNVIVGQVVWLGDCYIVESFNVYEFIYITTAKEPIIEKLRKKDTYIIYDGECRLYKKIYVNGVFRCNIIWIPEDTIKVREYL